MSSKKAGLFPRVFTTDLVLPTPAPPTNGASIPTTPAQLDSAPTTTSYFDLHNSQTQNSVQSNSLQYTGQLDSLPGSKYGSNVSVNRQPPNKTHVYPKTESLTDTWTDIDRAISELNRQTSTSHFNATGVHKNRLPTQQVHHPQEPEHVEQTPEIYSYSTVSSWNPQMVQQYFLSRGYDPQVCDCFLRHKISGSILLELDLAYLKEIDITSFGTRFEVSKEIKQLNQHVRNSAQILDPNTNTFVPVSISSTIPTSSTNSMAPFSGSSEFTPANTLMSPPTFKRQSVLRSAKDNAILNNFLASSPPSYHNSQITSLSDAPESNSHKKGPSFDRNWVHPATLKKQLNDVVGEKKHHYDSGTSGSEVNFKFKTPHSLQRSRVRSSTISTTDQYFYDNQVSPDAPAMPSPLLFHTGVSSPTTVDSKKTPGHSRQTSYDTIRGSGTKDEDASFYNFHKHSRSTSSMGLSDFKFLKPFTNGVQTHDEEHSKSVSLDSNSLPVPEKDSIHIESLCLEKECDRKEENLESEGKRIGTDSTVTRAVNHDDPGAPKRSSTSAGSKKKKPMLRSSSSHSNIRSKTNFSSAKQKTSAFQEGINSISPADAAKTASFSGWMSKRGSVAVGTWKTRFFTLHGTRLSYFTSFSDSRERGLIDITSHRVVAVGDSDDKFVAIYAASVGAGRFCFKVVPPLPGTRKGVTFTMPKVHYFAVDTREEVRAWMAALMKATIDRDDTVPTVSTCSTPTVPLVKAQELFAEARAKEELNRAKAIIADSNGIFGSQINAAWLSGFGQYGDGSPSTPGSPSVSSFKSGETESTNTISSLVKSTKVSSVDYFTQPVGLTGSETVNPDLKHVTTKTAGLRLVTDLENSDT